MYSVNTSLKGYYIFPFGFICSHPFPQKHQLQAFSNFITRLAGWYFFLLAAQIVKLFVSNQFCPQISNQKLKINHALFKIQSPVWNELGLSCSNLQGALSIWYKLNDEKVIKQAYTQVIIETQFFCTCIPTLNANMKDTSFGSWCYDAHCIVY